jgi:hypothetical protein
MGAAEDGRAPTEERAYDQSRCFCSTNGRPPGTYAVTGKLTFTSVPEPPKKAASGNPYRFKARFIAFTP